MSRKPEKETVDYVPGKQSASRFFGPIPQPVRVAFGAASHPGKVRPTNQDHYVVVRRRRSRTVLMTNVPAEALLPTEEDAYALLVADGMGGVAFGELASMLALRTAWDLSGRETAWPLNINQLEAHEMKEKLEAYAKLIHRALMDHARTDPKTAGMGTTLTIAYTVGAAAFIGHVGDSRAYLHRRGAVHQVTRDHTLAQKLADAGMPESETAEFGHMLTNILGGPGGHSATDVHHLALENGDALLLCTDGLTDLVTDDEIAQTLDSGEAPQELCDALVGLALDRGGRDNVTVVLARYDIPSPDPDRST
jgi:protein phosphatase